MKKILGIAVRFFNYKDVKFETRLFKLVEPIRCNAQTLYECIKIAFESNGVIYKDFLIGFASDNTNVMLVKNLSVAALLKKYVENITIFGCICHYAHLIASLASI